MSKAKKISIFTSFILIGLGICLSLGALCSVRFDISKLDTAKFTTNRMIVDQPFQNIQIWDTSSDIHFLPSDDNYCTVIYTEGDGISHSISVEDGTLTIARKDARKLIGYIGIFIEQDEITVYLPQAEYDSLAMKVSDSNIEIPKDFTFTSANIYSSSGDISFEADVKENLSIKTEIGNLFISDVNVQSMDAESTNGDMDLSNIAVSDDIHISTAIGNLSISGVTSKNMEVESTSGDIDLYDVMASNHIQIASTIGNITLNHSDATSLDVKTTSGNVSATLLSDKIFQVASDSGDVNIPVSNEGGKCKINTTIGDIDVEIYQ